MGVMPEGKTLKSAFIKGEEFEKGLSLIVNKVEIVKANNPKYGANDKDFLFTSNILKEGETVKYTFTERDEEGYNFQRTLENKSAGLYQAMSSLNPEPGTVVRITRSGSGTNTKWKVEPTVPTVNA